MSLALSPTTRFTQKVASNDTVDGKFSTKVVLNPSAPSDSSVVYFESVGTVYAQSLAANAAQPAPVVPATETTLNSNPTVSYDGKYFAYVSWNDQTLATLRVAATATPTSAFDVPAGTGRIARPSISPNNDYIGYIRLSGDVLSGETYHRGAGVYWRSMDFSSGTPSFGIPKGPFSGRHVSFSKDGKYAHVLVGDYPKSSLVRYDAQTTARTVIASSVYATDMRISPDESYMAFVEFRSVYVAKFEMPSSLPMNVTSIGSSRGVPNPAVRKVCGTGGDYLSWSQDGSKLRWGTKLSSKR